MSKSSTPTSSTVKSFTIDSPNSDDVIYLPQHISLIELDSTVGDEDIITVLGTPSKNKPNSTKTAPNDINKRSTNSDDVIYVPPYVPYVDLVTPPKQVSRRLGKNYFEKELENVRQKLYTIQQRLYRIDYLKKNNNDAGSNSPTRQPVSFREHLRITFPDSTKDKNCANGNIDVPNSTLDQGNQRSQGTQCDINLQGINILSKGFR